jgi:choline-sulfatase
LRDVAVILVSFCSLAGLVPDISHPVFDRLLVLVAVAAVSWLLLVAARRLPLFLAGATLFLVLAPFVTSGLAGRGGKPNVLWILLDTTRIDHVAPYGGLTRSPVVQLLASEGILFQDAVTVVPKTPASVASFMTGLYPYRHGVRALPDRLSKEVVTAAELFSHQGWHTAALVHNAWLARGRGFGQGFRSFSGYYDIQSPYGPAQYWSWLRFVDQLTVRRIPRFSPQTSSAVLTERAMRYLERYRDRPFFLYVHYFEPHWPYFPPRSLAREYGAPPNGDTLVNRVPLPNLTRGQMIFDNPLPEEENRAALLLYRAEVEHTLQQVGRLLDRLDELGLRENTLVVFTTDHGHNLGEHGYWYHHGEFLYDESLRIPLVLRWPGRLPGGRVVSEQVRSIDVLPTLARLVGLRHLPRVDGRALEGFWQGEASSSLEAYLESDVRMFRENDRRPIDGIPGKSRAIRDGRYKLILTPTPEGSRLELFDLHEDPAELLNLAGDPQHRQSLGRLLARLESLTPVAERGFLAPQGSEERDADAIGDRDQEMLQSLGYVN